MESFVQAQLGLPEVLLGLLPAAGGTQRLPRLIGVPAALDLITTGRYVTAAEALKLGMVDQVTDKNTVEAAIKFALSVVGQSLESRRISTLPCPCPADMDALFERVMQRVKQSARGAMAPVACVQAVQAAATLPYAQGIQRERELMDTLFTSGQARALQYCFFSQRVVSRWSMPNGARWDNSKPKHVSKVAVIGLGTMGRGITVALALAGLSVVAVETQQQQMMAGQSAVSGMLARAAQKRGVPSVKHQVHYSVELEAVADVELVIEAVFEDLGLKKQIFKRLSSVCKTDTLLCSNTSALDIDELASQTHRPELVVGMHFFAPAHLMKLLEVVYGPRSAPQAVATVMKLGKRIGKVSVAVGNCRGFVSNRMLKLYAEQAVFLVEEGASPEMVDHTLEKFGFPMGLFRMSDLSGLDVGWKVRKAEGLVEPGQMSRVRQGRRYCPLGDLLCEQGRFGQKTGRGWYLYEPAGSREARPDPWLQSFLEEYRARQGLVPRRIDSQEVLERCLYSLINEGFNILQEGIAAGPEDIDMIYVFGFSFPRHRGGPMFYASQVGLSRVLQRLEHYQQQHPDVPYLQPSSLLRRLVSSGSPPIQKWKEVMRTPHSAL
ncbi:peroxisomal bifunctional enzyme isoform X2 [Boleophthalmus pectinirostris]|uniref:peroxisomal bifunctional enzyme isoform X2 n=1 Tax=Boleophthalmus pectinirostris TaxID=150288 RepID=UPI000A1C4D3B|nr:peroxisomal bifunctional enzyme isoform X2 [Boleophthalmus pectinirostris]